MHTNKHRGRAVFILFAMAAVLACNPDGGGPEPYQYPSDTAAVDYTSSDPGKAVFIDFSSNTVVRELPHDFFDVAMYSTGSGQGAQVHIIANSGSYGTGVTVLKTTGTDIAANLSGSENAVTEFTFREDFTLHGHQDAVNPLAGAAAAAATKYVYLIKTNYGTDTKYFKVVFDSYGPAGQCKITVVPGSGAGDTGKVELTAGLTGIADGYGYIYFDLHGNTPRVLNDGDALKPGITLNIPKAAEWDLLCTRTDDLTGDTTRPTANRSSILLNTYKGVTAATAAGKTIEEVTGTTGLTPYTLVDAIGYSWYGTDNRGNYWVDNPPVTFVIKTAEEHYAKFQPGSFKGPAEESFHMAFRYYYTGNNTGVFEH
ncbi:MAG: HmuY family protein [Spirochaetaceae bacterium]|jgi:hypothetical protein|nr:HmuY family protein [Spirochaetaceae bacterium]